MAVAIDRHHDFNRFQRCRLQSFTQPDFSIFELSQTNLAHSLKQAFEVANIHRSFSTPCFSLATRVEEELDTKSPRVEIVNGCAAPLARALVAEVTIAMLAGVDPLLMSSGLGGAYLLRNMNGDNIAVAKPVDEEPLAVNNPKGFGGLMLGQPGIKRSIRVGETGIRELAAYLLDHEGFAAVPPTALVKIAHLGFHVTDAATKSSPPPYKIASLQQFIEHDFDAGELGPSVFSVASVHRVGIFDIRVLNLDRHAGNILVKKNANYAIGAAELVPIDHGLCLPEWLDDPYFEWLHWPQAFVPFSESEVEYVSNLNPFRDAELLRTELPTLRESSIRVLVLCTIFLKKAVASGLCLADIGKMMTREFGRIEGNLSLLENLCVKALENTVNGFNDVKNKQSKEETAKPPKIPRFSCKRSMPKSQNATLCPLYEENGHEVKTIDSDDRDDSKAAPLTRSKNYYIQNCESEGISLGNMNEGEWDLFLKCFQQFLHEAFEGVKCMSLKQRLGMGTSCKF